VGNSSGDENGRDSMKYWEIIADKLSAADWSWGLLQRGNTSRLARCCVIDSCVFRILPGPDKSEFVAGGVSSDYVQLVVLLMVICVPFRLEKTQPVCIASRP
jgi:hypothetical protein